MVMFFLNVFYKNAPLGRPTAVFCPCSLSWRMTPSVAALAAAVGTEPLAALAAAAAGSAEGGREQRDSQEEAGLPGCDPPTFPQRAIRTAATSVLLQLETGTLQHGRQHGVGLG